jgi:ribonuclease HI
MIHRRVWRHILNSKRLNVEFPLMAFTDGSGVDDLAGSGIAVYSDKHSILTIRSPIRNVSIDYAELFAVYSLLKWLHIRYRCNNKQIHIFTDSLNTVRNLGN